MRKTRKKDTSGMILEGVYDFYEAYDNTPKKTTTEKILDYYLDKILKYGENSLTSAETKIFNDAKRGKLSLEKPVYKIDKVTGDIENDNLGNPIRIDTDQIIPGVPFITAKGKGAKKKEIIKGRCYWNVDEDFKTFFVYGGEVTDTNPQGLVVWKTVSNKGSEFGAFIIPKGEANITMEELWKNNAKKYDAYASLDKETYVKFLEFDDLFHKSKKENIKKITELCAELKRFPPKK